MIKSQESILLSCENSQKLAKFYEEKVGLKLTSEFEMGDNAEKGYYFESVKLYINQHSEVKGKNSQPQRYMINFETDDIEAEVKRLDSAGIKKIQDIYHVEGYGLIATYEDVDGNYFQVVQVRAS